MIKIRKYKLFEIAIIVSVLLSGCGDKKGSEGKQNLESVTKENENIIFEDETFLPDKVSLSFGFASENLLLANENNIVNTTFSFEMDPAGWDMGVLVFVDGYLQPISMSGEGENIFHIITIDETMNKDVSFDLVSGREKEKVRIDALSLFHPAFQVKKDTITAGISFSTSSPLPAATICEKTVVHEEGANNYEYKEIPQKIKDRYIIQKDDGTVENHFLNNQYSGFYQDGEERQWIDIQDGILSCELYVCGGFYEEYNIYLFLDNQLLCGFDGKEYCTVKVSSEKAVVIPVRADISNMNIQEYTQIFGVAVPSGKYMDDDVYIEKIVHTFVHNEN